MGWIHGYEHGMAVRTRDGGGRTLVWIHGLGESGRCFDAITALPALAGYRHVIPDLPGYGRSPWPARAPSIVDTADALAAWLAARGDGAVVIGHSLGGVLATLCVGRHPTAARAVIDVDGNVCLDDCTYSRRLAGFAEADAARAADEVWAWVAGAAGGDVAMRGYAASLGFADPAVLWRHAVELVALSSDDRLAQRRAALAVPFLYIAGAPGGASPRSRALLAEAGIEVEAIGPAGHWPFIDQPAAFATVLTGFVQKRVEDSR